MTSQEKKALSERDICSKFIAPAQKKARRDEMTQIREEASFTKGRMLVRVLTAKHGEGKRTNYLLSYEPDVPPLVMETKDNHHSVGAGMQQVLGYAGINVKDLKKMRIAVPFLAEQQRIVAKVDELMIWCDALESHILTASLRQLLRT